MTSCTRVGILGIVDEAADATQESQAKRRRNVDNLLNGSFPVGDKRWHGFSSNSANVHDLDVPYDCVDSGKIESAHLVELLIRG